MAGLYLIKREQGASELATVGHGNPHPVVDLYHSSA